MKRRIFVQQQANRPVIEAISIYLIFKLHFLFRYDEDENCMLN